ncbi:MAG TPA: cytochrome c-type biogenesis protein [Thermoanaerobaculia bacterium]|nr:cytochrome c-type biogenesis protein [Thermoanaerobaculia bacterium]
MRRLGLLVALVSLVAPALAAQEVRLPSPREIVGPPRGRPLSGAELQEKTREVASLLRCPVCQGLSIQDSPAPMAINMKRQVEELAAEGYDREQILAYFEASYGEFVRLNPAMRGMNWLVWIAPAILALAGAWAVRSVLRRGRAAAAAESAQPDAPPPPDPDLEPYLRKVRDLADAPTAPTERS